jgi:hypothetical protein
VLDDADAGVDVKLVEFSGLRDSSLVINISQFSFQGIDEVGGTITLYNVTRLTTSDIDSVAPIPSPHD